MRRYSLLSFVVILGLALLLPGSALAHKKGKKGKKAKAAEPVPAADLNDPKVFRADVLRFIDASGGMKGADILMKGMIDQFRVMHPEVPNELWDAFLAEIDLDEFANLLAPIYEKHFTHAEILDAIAFYEGPTGKKFSDLAPVLTQEGMAVGQVWGRTLAERVLSDVLEQEPPPDEL